ncbi:MAG: hypothetical protein ACP5H2_09950 [Solirubrobacteraceae bacterium]
MKFYSIWQPLKNEDALTALVFGFLRHAPAELALQAWLTQLTGEPVATGPLTSCDFWPRYESLVGGHQSTEPDLAFQLDASGSWVIVEAKPLYKQHDPHQLGREAVDTVHATGAQRATVVMVGADLGAPVEYATFEAEVRRQLAEHNLKT